MDLVLFLSSLYGTALHFLYEFCARILRVSPDCTFSILIFNMQRHSLNRNGLFIWTVPRILKIIGIFECDKQLVLFDGYFVGLFQSSLFCLLSQCTFFLFFLGLFFFEGLSFVTEFYFYSHDPLFGVVSPLFLD